MRRQSPNHSEISSNALVSKYHYGLRLDGKRYSVTESGPATNGATTNYTYDDQGKLTQEAGPYATIAYTYDAVGNRLTRTVTNAATGNGTTLVNGATATSYDVNDRIATVNGGVTHTYDADGNETTVNGQAASYDFENHLVSLGSVASYVYDADGNRYSASNLGTTTSYVMDTSLAYASVVEEYSGTATVPSARYDYGDDLVRMDRGGVYYYIYDGLGSTRQLINPSGAVTDSYGYSAFGELASHTGTTTNPFLFNAQQLDSASGDYYLRARYYDQSNGRFISQDPFVGSDEDPISLHRYLYASDDPTDRVDPAGMSDDVDDAQGKGYIRVVLDAFIPTEMVKPNILGGMGDNRQFSSASHKHFRARHSIVIDPRTDQSWHWQHTGDSHDFLGRQARGDSSSMETEVNTMIPGEMWSIHIEGNPSYPFMPSPGITYSFDLTVDIFSMKSTVLIADHDSYPAYEIWRYSDTQGVYQVYGFNPAGGDNAFKLARPNAWTLEAALKALINSIPLTGPIMPDFGPAL